MGSTSGDSGSVSFSPKIRPQHLDRLAVFYVRQSTAQQIAENRVSTDRQYVRVRRAIVLGCSILWSGWWSERVYETVMGPVSVSGGSSRDSSRRWPTARALESRQISKRMTH